MLAIAGAMAAPLASLRAEEGFSAAEREEIRQLSLASLTPLPPDSTNRFADLPAAAAFGATLFFEQRLSRDGNVACATCHRIERGFQDDLPLAMGLSQGNRRTMPLAGVGWNRWFFWDGRRDSLWAQALVPMEDPREQGLTRTAIVRIVAERFGDRYRHIFGPLPDLSLLPRDAGPLGNATEQAAWQSMARADRMAVDEVFANIGKALAAFERTIVPEETRFDRFAGSLEEGISRPDAQFTDQEAQGLKLFIGKAACTTCHSGALFSDGEFHNNGVPPADRLPPDVGRAQAIDQVRSDTFNCLGPHRDGPASACERGPPLPATGEGLEGAFKTPSLRKVASRPPYMHAGQLSTLEAVVEHYSAAPAAAIGTSAIQPLDLTTEEKAALVAFLRALD